MTAKYGSMKTNAKIISAFCSFTIVTKECSNDPMNYQSCAMAPLSKKIVNSEALCDQVICEIYDRAGKRLLKYNHQINKECKAVNLYGWRQHKQCKPQLNEATCQDFTLVTECDTICQERDTCIDEAECNGYRYGMFCEISGKMTYVQPKKICDAIRHCDNLMDELPCTKSHYKLDINSCARSEGINLVGTLVPILNITRCGPVERDSTRSKKYFSFCKDFKDQYNCTDPDRGVLMCEVNGYATTVSVGMICLDTRLELCDDGIDKVCLKTSESCSVHKHLLCDGKHDCRDSSDESNDLCKDLFGNKCHRR